MRVLPGWSMTLTRWDQFHILEPILDTCLGNLALSFHSISYLLGQDLSVELSTVLLMKELPYFLFVQCLSLLYVVVQCAPFKDNSHSGFGQLIPVLLNSGELALPIISMWQKKTQAFKNFPSTCISCSLTEKAIISFFKRYVLRAAVTRLWHKTRTPALNHL